MLDDEHSMVRVSLLTVVSLSVLGAGGCQRASTLLGAIACQGLGRPASSSETEDWTFRGLDPRVRPRVRPGSYASATHGVRFVGPEDLGRHRYWLDGAETNGIIYTCAGGHIDLAHVRKAADWTGYLAAVTLDEIHSGQTTFQFKLLEPSRYFVELAYPKDWATLPVAEKERVARDVSRQIGQYLAYTAMTWHEMLTWFGFRPKRYKSEFQSAFSWEDGYSNLLGTCVAAEALHDQSRQFSDAVTVALHGQLESLGAQPAVVARQASEAIRGDWYFKWWFFTVIRKRNCDIGVDDARVTPCIVSPLPACESAQACPLAIPTLDGLTQHGFSATITIEPRVWETSRILKALYGDRRPATKRLDPSIHFAPLIEYIEQDALNHRHLTTDDPDLKRPSGFCVSPKRSFTQ